MSQFHRSLKRPKCKELTRSVSSSGTLRVQRGDAMILHTTCPGRLGIGHDMKIVKKMMHQNVSI